MPRLWLGTVPRLSLGMVSDSRTMSESRTVTIYQLALCLLADFDAPAAAGLLPSIRRGGLRAGRANPERRSLLVGSNPALRDRRASRAGGIHPS
jgi:hypothetical protein